MNEYQIDRDENGLTARHREVMDLLAKGCTQAQIRRDLGLTKQRVSAIVRTLRKKGAL